MQSFAAGGRVESTNAAFLRLVGRERSEVVNQLFEAIVADQDLVGLLGFNGVFGAEATVDNKVIFVASDGGHRTLLVNSRKSKTQLLTLLTARAIGAIEQELNVATRWAATEQDRANDIAQARDALATTNAALSAAQSELEHAYAKLQSELEIRSKLEGELRLAQKLEAVGQLAAGIEINTPAQYVGDSIQFLAESFQGVRALVTKYRQAVAQFPPSPDQELLVKVMSDAEEEADLVYIDSNAPGAFERATNGIERIAAIVSAMKDFAHPDGRTKCPADINRAIQATLTIANNECKYVADIETYFGDIPPVCCHVGDINQVILNLLINAAHSIADVVGSGGNRGRITVQTAHEGDFVRVDLSDTGSGIPADIRDRIFDPFFTTKEVGRGSGQGLAISRSIVVEKHGGSISVESEVGKGTTFTIRLPIEAPAAGGQ